MAHIARRIKRSVRLRAGFQPDSGGQYSIILDAFQIRNLGSVSVQPVDI